MAEQVSETTPPGPDGGAAPDAAVAAGPEATAEPLAAPDPRAERIAALETELAEAKDRALRLQAEMINFRNRQEREKGKWRRDMARGILTPLFDPLDHLQLAAESAATGREAEPQQRLKTLLEGVDLVIRQIAEGLQKNGIEVVDPMGRIFDPNFHQACGNLPTAAVQAGHVALVMRRGYVLEGECLRPALVQVAAPPAGAPVAETGVGKVSGVSESGNPVQSAMPKN